MNKIAIDFDVFRRGIIAIYVNVSKPGAEYNITVPEPPKRVKYVQCGMGDIGWEYPFIQVSSYSPRACLTEDIAEGSIVRS